MEIVSVLLINDMFTALRIPNMVDKLVSLGFITVNLKGVSRSWQMLFLKKKPMFIPPNQK
jgi:hypothetical protein